MNTYEPMRNLSIQQKQEAEQFFSKALQSARNNDYVTATQYYRQAAEYGHPGAQNNLGNLYQSGRGVEKDLQKAVSLFSESAKQGNVYGMRNLASCYLNGIGTESNFDLAIDWLETAAEQKDNLACAMLAKAYDNWQHKDDEKKLYWHKKAAEYGNADSMFFLGDYYAHKEGIEDLDQAKYYLDLAAKSGTPEMKLKVAQAFDLDMRNEFALSLEKAKYWYSEVLQCDNDNLKLNAAKGLDELCDYLGDVRRPALDITKAYMTYRILAANGNREACILSAYCSEIGKGTLPNIDIAIMLYEKANEKERADWCRKKKAGSLSDEVYENNVQNEMPINPGNIHSHRKEFYRYNVDFDVSAYNGKIYYIKSSYSASSYLCSSELDGGNIRVISELDDDFYFPNIHVNVTGIYLYREEAYDGFWIKHLGFDGKLLGEYRENYELRCEDDFRISKIYIYDDELYYVCEYNIGSTRKCEIRCLHVDEETVEIIYSKATSIENLYATDKQLFFYARYENDDCVEEWAEGWMMLDLNSHCVECLSNPYYSAEHIVDNPSVYDTEDPEEYQKIKFNRNIVFFDLNRNIFWTERTAMEGTDSAHLKPVKYWEPKSLFGNRDENVQDMPVWKMPNNLFSTRREYFDGTYHYYSTSYEMFESSTKNGTVSDWSTKNYGHGACNEFRVVDKYLFLNVAAMGEEQYQLTTEVSLPIRKSWFDDPIPEEVFLTKETRDTEAVSEKNILPILPVMENVSETDDIGDLCVEKVIGDTDIKYNICTFGAKFHIGFGIPVTIIFNNNKYQSKSHNTAKGRIDGLKKMYTENGIMKGDKLRATYIADRSEIYLEKI